MVAAQISIPASLTVKYLEDWLGVTVKYFTLLEQRTGYLSFITPCFYHHCKIKLYIFQALLERKRNQIVKYAHDKPIEFI